VHNSWVSFTADHPNFYFYYLLRISFARSGCSVGKNRPVVTLDHIVQKEFGRVFKYVLLFSDFVENEIESEL
jgi:hypothetical protein